jgi:hypothetical protein
MRAAHTSPHVRYALLLATFLGGIALWGVVFAPPRQNDPHPPHPEHSQRFALATGGIPADTAPQLRSARLTNCTQTDRDAFHEDVVVDTNQWYCGHVTAYGGDITVLGRVSSDVIAIGGNIAISGEVDGRVLSLGGNVALLPGAHVSGDVQALGGTVSRSPGVVVGGQIDRGMSTDQFALPNITSIIPVRLDWADVIFWAFSGLIIAFFLPSQLIRVRLMARRQPTGSLFLGLLAYGIGIVSAIVLALTCLGIPLALAIGVVLWGGSIFGTAALGAWLGSALIPGAADYKRFPFILATVLGVTLLAIASTAPVIGGVIRALVSMEGLGATLLTIATMRRPLPARRALG